MLNFRLLKILTNTHSIRIYLGIISVLGISVLLDILLFLKLAFIIGPWITMSALSINTAAGIYFMNFLTSLRNRQLISSIDSGKYDPDIFSRYVSTLVASLFIITPGLLNSLLGLMLLIPPFNVKTGSKIARMMGINWQEAHEFLRLDRVTGVEDPLYAES